MKKCFLLLGPILFSLALQGGVRKILMAEVPVRKTVCFSVYASTNYSTKLYKQSKAKILLSIWKYNRGKQQLVWSSTIDAGSLKNYPSADQALFKEVSIYNVKEKQEILVAGYKVIYDQKGSTIAYDKGYIVPVGDSTKMLSIPI